MDKFLQQFKDNLDNQPAPEFDEQDWMDMQQRLDQQTQSASKPIHYWAWAVALLLLGIIGSNWWQIKELKKASKKISQLESKLDTVVQTKIIYRTDTIYLKNEEKTDIIKNKITNPNILETKKVASSPYLKAQRQNLRQKIFNQDGKTTITLTINKAKSKRNKFAENATDIYNPPNKITSLSNDFQIEQRATKASNEHIVTNEKVLLRNDNDPINKKGNNYLIIPPLKASKISVHYPQKRPLPTWFETPTNFIQQKKTLGQPIYHARPKGLEIGLSYGFGTLLADHYNHSEVNQGGLIARLIFAQPFRLWIAADYTALEYKSKRVGEQYGVPEIVPPADNLEFEDTKVHRNLWSVTTGLQYNFRANKKWQPFIGVGYGLSSFLANKIRYEFREPGIGRGNDTSLDVSLANGKNLPHALFKAGIGYTLPKKIRMELKGMYLHRVNNFNHQLPNTLSGNLSLLYDF